jgi:hypothetical protein
VKCALCNRCVVLVTCVRKAESMVTAEREGGIGSCSDKDLMISSAPLAGGGHSAKHHTCLDNFCSSDLSVPSAQCSVLRFYLRQQQQQQRASKRTYTQHFKVQ